ncbi:unnamed protein product, partial [Prorocentrum cordatum]
LLPLLLFHLLFLLLRLSLLFLLFGLLRLWLESGRATAALAGFVSSAAPPRRGRTPAEAGMQQRWAAVTAASGARPPAGRPGQPGAISRPAGGLLKPGGAAASSSSAAGAARPAAGANTASFTVSTQSKKDEIGIQTLVGDYADKGTNHGRRYYQKNQKIAGHEDVKVFLYYWDERDGADFSGWWFGDALGGSQVSRGLRVRRLASRSSSRAGSLNYLDLARNGIRDAGATALAAALGGNCALRELHLAQNRIRGPGGPCPREDARREHWAAAADDGVDFARAVGLALPGSASLWILSLRRCGIGSEGARLRAQGLSAQRVGLTELSVGLNRFRDNGAAEIAKMLTVSRSIRELYVDDNRIGRSGGAFIGEALMGNYCLQTLWMTIKTNSTLRRLGLTVDASIGKALRQAMDRATPMPKRGVQRSDKWTADNFIALPSAVPNACQDSRGVPQRHSNDSGTGSEADSPFDTEEFDGQQGVAEARGQAGRAEANHDGAGGGASDDVLDVETLPPLPSDSKSDEWTADNIIALPSAEPNACQDSRGISQRHSHDSGTGSEAFSPFNTEDFDDQQAFMILDALDPAPQAA